MSMFKNDRSTLNPTTWKSFYEDQGHGTTEQGLLPFRVKQFYEEMVKFVNARKLPEFVAAAGILSHYIGDAAQPLHSSRLHHGSNDSEKGVHAQYETKMVERFRVEIVDEINRNLDGGFIGSSLSGAQAAAEACMDLMDLAMDSLPPQTIIDSFNNAGSGRARNEDMFKDLGDLTIDLLIQSSLYLADIWQSAWLRNRLRPSASMRRFMSMQK